MQGNITKKDFLAIAQVIGIKTALKILLSSRPVALQVLVAGLKGISI